MNKKAIFFIGLVLSASSVSALGAEEIITLFEADCNARKERACTEDDLVNLMSFIKQEYLLDLAAIKILEEGKEISRDDQRAGFSVDDLKKIAQARKDFFDEINDDLQKMGCMPFEEIDKNDLGSEEEL